MMGPLFAGSGGGGIDGHTWLLDPAVSHAWIADPGYVSAPDGTSAVAWLPAKGGIPLTQDIAESRPTFCSNWGNDQGCFRMNGVNQYFEAHALAAAIVAGTNRPFSVICAAQNLRIQSGHYWSFARDVAIPAPNGPYFILYNDGMATNGRPPITRNNDANSAVQGTPTQTVGLARVVLTFVFNGSTGLVRLNGANTSVTAQSLTGTFSVNQFRVGTSGLGPVPINSFLPCNYRALIVGTSAWSASTYEPIERALLREF